MIIVSQNKQMILNFNRISYLSIGENHKGSINKKDLKYSIYADDTKNIGDYPTLDRAKEVLKEIYQYYDVVQDSIVNHFTENEKLKTFYFEMPEE